VFAFVVADHQAGQAHLVSRRGEHRHKPTLDQRCLQFFHRVLVFQPLGTVAGARWVPGQFSVQ
jgi:hypothetical protein